MVIFSFHFWVDRFLVRILRELDETKSFWELWCLEFQYFHELFLFLMEWSSKGGEWWELEGRFDGGRVKEGTGFKLISSSHFCTIKINITGLKNNHFFLLKSELWITALILIGLEKNMEGIRNIKILICYFIF